MATFIANEAIEAIGTSSSEGEDCSGEEDCSSEEVPVQNRVGKRSRKRGNTFSSEEEQETQGSRVKKKASFSKHRSKTKNKNKRVTRPLSSEREQSEQSDREGQRPQTRDEMILAELKKTNQLLHSISKRVEKNEGRIKHVEKHYSSPGSSTSTPKSSRKKDVPQEVRVSNLPPLPPKH